MVFENKEIDTKKISLQCTNMYNIYYKINNKIPLFIKYFDVDNPLIISQ